MDGVQSEEEQVTGQMQWAGGHKVIWNERA